MMKKYINEQDQVITSANQEGQSILSDPFLLTSQRRFILKNKKKHANQNTIIDFDKAKQGFEFERQRLRHVEIIPRNIAQESYVTNLLDPSLKITFAVGPAGTGKTLLATLAAIKAFKEGQVSRIVVTRPAVSAEEKHGFLPGDLNQKMDPWVRPIMDVFEEYWSPVQIQKMLADRTIEIAPLAYMRGRTFKDCFIIFDEAQNAVPSQMKMALTRIGEGSRMSVTGDLEQHDRGYEENGLKDILDRMSAIYHGISVDYFKKEHVEREAIVQTILDIYEK